MYSVIEYFIIITYFNIHSYSDEQTWSRNPFYSLTCRRSSYEVPNKLGDK